MESSVFDTVLNIRIRISETVKDQEQTLGGRQRGLVPIQILAHVVQFSAYDQINNWPEGQASCHQYYFLSV